jgi:hypothetical protein
MQDNMHQSDIRKVGMVHCQRLIVVGLHAVPSQLLKHDRTLAGLTMLFASFEHDELIGPSNDSISFCSTYNLNKIARLTRHS